MGICAYCCEGGGYQKQGKEKRERIIYGLLVVCIDIGIGIANANANRNRNRNNKLPKYHLHYSFSKTCLGGSVYV